MKPRTLVWLFVLLAALSLPGTPANATPRAHVPLLVESTELLLPADQKKLETGDEQQARERGQFSKKKRRGAWKRGRKQAHPGKAKVQRDPPNSGNFDGEGVPVDHTH